MVTDAEDLAPKAAPEMKEAAPEAKEAAPVVKEAAPEDEEESAPEDEEEDEEVAENRQPPLLVSKSYLHVSPGDLDCFDCCAHCSRDCLYFECH